MALDIVWFRRDLRLGDNPAWSAGTAQEVVCPLFVIDPRVFPRVSPRRQAALAACLVSLDASLRLLGGRLRVETGDPAIVVPAVARELDSATVHVNGEVTPYGRERDRRVERRVNLATHDGVYLHPPGSILTAAGTAYRVFAPFHRAWAQRFLPHVDAPGDARPTGESGAGIPSVEPAPAMGEGAALARLESFGERADSYHVERDRPDLDSTSRLSIDLKYGTVGALTVRRYLGEGTEGRRAFTRQLAWRDFYGHLMAAMPESVAAPIRPEFAAIPWADDPAGLDAWKRGMTGFPIVDAGMRQLAGEGWIHNRVRMLVASFLVKDLLVDWRIGERFLRRHLLDGDVAQNVGNWQWVAGTGTDAAPFFRVFNPMTQSARFDPDGAYIRRWVPELAHLESPAVHAPWGADPERLAAAGVVLGETYPWPLVDHGEARGRALDAFAVARSGR